MHIDEILRDQDGVVSRRQALDAGMTEAAIAYRLASKAWVRVAPEVYRSAQHAATDRARIRTQALWLGPDATLMSLGAAWWLRMVEQAPARVRFAVPTTRRVRGRGDAHVRRRDVEAHERLTVDGVPTTTRAVTVVDAVAELGAIEGAQLMDRALLRGRVTIDGLRSAHRAGLGRPGSRSVGRVIALAAGGARFEAERELHRLLHEAGIAGWVADLPVALPGYGDAVLDLAFREAKVLVEVDGWAYHRDLDAFRRDRRRQNALVLAGWTVVRVTWFDLVEGPDRVRGWIVGALAGDRCGGSSPVA